ncbi:MAG: hypothetical protein HUJ22_05485 [Gracilimonas sp.]|uniref:capsule assembly Wzi family protein n=1 Tax=Gracilimonas sp. TaxID=1974203 RepID=UPI0019837436|nr:capsule assembly Wzi family protein [Gracilimonas sp.]MBD3616007.1 hypothetical protein [Gracilimonas sp.]
MILINILRKAFLLLVIVAFTPLQLWAQEDTQKPTVDLKTGATFFMNPQGLDQDLPFWMHANNDGRIDQNSANALHYVEGYSQIFKNSVFEVEAGASFVSRDYADTQVSYFDKAYLKLHIYDFKFMAGRYIDPLAEKEEELSTGSFMYSRNATPIPKIAFSTDGFAEVPGTNGIIRYNGLFAHGWLENDRYVQNAYLHEKYFYLSIKYDFFDAVGGIVHNVQWAGESQSLGALPEGWQTYWEVITATGSSDADAPGGERSNAVGNAVAAYDFSLGLFFDRFDLRAYRLFYLEDKVSTQFRSPWDGIWGLTIKPKNIQLVKNITWEHVNTKRQDSFDFEPRGSASYYNNFLYRSGWTYQGRVIGNPMITTDGTINRPIYNNIIVAHHLGLSGELLSNLDYKFLYTFSRNYGTWEDQIIQRLPQEQCGAVKGQICAELRPLSNVKQLNHSFLMELRSVLPQNERFSYGLTLSSDLGEFYGNRFGVGFNFEYQLLK